MGPSFTLNLGWAPPKNYPFPTLIKTIMWVGFVKSEWAFKMMKNINKKLNLKYFSDIGILGFFGRKRELRLLKNYPTIIGFSQEGWVIIYDGSKEGIGRKKTRWEGAEWRRVKNKETGDDVGGQHPLTPKYQGYLVIEMQKIINKSGSLKYIIPKLFIYFHKHIHSHNSHPQSFPHSRYALGSENWDTLCSGTISYSSNTFKSLLFRIYSSASGPSLIPIKYWRR